MDAGNLWELDRQIEIAMDALRCPPGETTVTHALGRRAPPRGAVPAAALAPRPAAARRAHQPPRRRVGGVARALPQGLHGHGRRGDARSLLPRQRRRLDPGARPRRGHSVGGQLLVLARAEEEPARSRRRRPSRRARRRSSASSSGCAWRRARGRPRARRASRPTRRCSPRSGSEKIENVEIYIPPGPRLGNVVIEADSLRKALRRQAADRRPVRSSCRPPASSA